MHVNHVGLGVEVILPDILQQHGARHHLTGMLHQVFEQAELARLQGDILAAAGAAVCQTVKLKICNPVGRLAVTTGFGPAPQRLDTGQQLCEGERLGQIVIATSPKARHPVVDLTECREDQHRCMVTALAQ